MSKTAKWLLGLALGLPLLGGSCIACLALAVNSTGDAKTQPKLTPEPGPALDGRWGCSQASSEPGLAGQLQPVPVPGFRISGGTYSDAKTQGTVVVSNDVIAFSGGALDGWRGRLGADSKPFVAISGEDPGTVTATTGAGPRDYKCYLQAD